MAHSGACSSYRAYRIPAVSPSAAGGEVWAPGHALQLASTLGLYTIMSCRAHDLRRQAVVFWVKSVHSYPRRHCIWEMPALSHPIPAPNTFQMKDLP